jgi:predicted metal-dependent phosphoesterase TrpH
MHIDLHTHSNVSDGTDTPAQLVANAVRAGLDLVALSDHDTMAGVRDAQLAGAQLGIQVVRGMEITCEHQGHTVHLLGLGIRHDHTALRNALARVRDSRRERVPKIVAKLNDLGYDLSIADVQEAARDAATVGRPHVAEALIAKGYFDTVNEVFEKLLDEGGPAYVGHLKLPLAKAIDLVRSGGGVAIWAHPWGRGGQQWFNAKVIAAVTSGCGLDGIEVEHQLHDPGQRAELHEIATTLNLIPTGGSDYHGTNKTDHDLGVNQTSEANWLRIAGRILERRGEALLSDTPQ